jgi:hypothetical protein
MSTWKIPSGAAFAHIQTFLLGDPQALRRHRDSVGKSRRTLEELGGFRRARWDFRGGPRRGGDGLLRERRSGFRESQSGSGAGCEEFSLGHKASLNWRAVTEYITVLTPRGRCAGKRPYGKPSANRQCAAIW